MTGGALVHIEQYGIHQVGGDSLLLDLNPITYMEPDEALASGRSWTDPERSVRFTVGERTSSGLPVTVTYLSTWAPPVRDLTASGTTTDLTLTWRGWPGRTPTRVAVRRSSTGCPETPTQGTAVGGSQWRTSQTDTVRPGAFVCYGVFAGYGASWSPPVWINPGCSVTAAAAAPASIPARPFRTDC